jgi:Protein of unknown function (DUF4038)/Putative collagen-binding domain of a collagenase
MRLLNLLLPAAVLWTVLIAHCPAGNTAEAAQSSAVDPMPPYPAAAFPLRVAPNSRYLEDSAGRPFLVKGDAAWSLIAEPKRDDVDVYLRDRRSRGFNTVLVSLIEHYFATNAPANAYGDPPFLTPGRFDTPNEAYFAHADWVIQRAYEEGFLVLLAPSYAGAGGGHEGWYQEMLANGVDKLREYGRYVGRRYRRFPNIVWVENGDYNPPRKDIVRAVEEGIHESDPGALQTVHNTQGVAGAEYWPGETWFQLNTVYTWAPVFPAARAQYVRSPTLPFILIEGQYENGPGITTPRLRAQAYQALLTGAAGEVFGNSPIWYFDGTNDYPRVPQGWRNALSSAGSRSMAHLHALFARLPWQTLEPDIDNRFLVRGEGFRQLRAVAAVTHDRSTAVVYLPSTRTVTLDMSKLSGPAIRAWWYDPSAGKTIEIVGPPLRAGGLKRFRPAPANAEGTGDWVLLLQAEKN